MSGRFKKLSLLSLVLMGASAVCAFIIPKANKKVFANGHLEWDSHNGNNFQLTCRTGLIAGATKCDYTQTNGVNSFTSVDGNVTSVAGLTSHNPGLSNTGLKDDGNGTLVTTP